MNSPLLLDTHALVWLVDGSQRLGRTGREMAEAALQTDSLLVSAMSFWEIAMLVTHHRIELAEPVTAWRRRALESGIREIPLSGDIGILAAELEGFHADPADRIITATAIAHEAVLATADRRILAWQGNLQRHDARS